MIETLDPNLGVQPPVQPDAQQTEPIRPESVKIEEQKLERRKSGDEEEEDRKRRRRKKDKVEISSMPDSEEETLEEDQQQANPKGRRASEHQIDILI
jgi:hypothetical protein